MHRSFQYPRKVPPCSETFLFCQKVFPLLYVCTKCLKILREVCFLPLLTLFPFSKITFRNSSLKTTLTLHTYHHKIPQNFKITSYGENSNCCFNFYELRYIFLFKPQNRTMDNLRHLPFPPWPACVFPLKLKSFSISITLCSLTLKFSMSYSKDRSLDSGLSCPDDDLDLNENENLTSQNVIPSASCPDFDGKQR